MTDIGSHDYIFASLEEKVAWMQAGQGTDQTFQAGDGLKRISVRMQQSDDNLGQVMRRTIGQAWQGRGASAAADSLGRTAAAMTATAGSADHGGGSTHSYGDSFNQVKNAIGTQPPEAVGKQNFLEWVQDGLGGTSDYRDRLARYRAANKLATDALERHEASARQTLAGFREAMQTAVTPPGAGTGDRNGVPTTTGARINGTTGGRSAGAPAAGPGSTGVQPAGPGQTDTQPTGPRPTDIRPPGPRQAATQVAGPGQASTAAGTQAAGSGSIGVPPGGGRTPPPANSTQVGTPDLSGGMPVSGYPGSTGAPDGWPGGEQRPPARGGWPGAQQPAPRGGPGTGEPGRWSGGSGAAGRLGTGSGGMPPMGMGMGGGAGGSERRHRNENYVPSDGPFQIDPDDLVDEHGDAVAPPVIGMAVPNAAPRVEAWERW